jgi:UDP-glucuronate 4-epimerase
MKILVTGTAGFIGFHLARALLIRGDEVVGLDSINNYYDVNLKYARLAETGIREASLEYAKLTQSNQYANYRFIQLSLDDHKNLNQLFQQENFDAVCHLAAQAGVRYSLDHPMAYINSNIVGFMTLLEACRHYEVKNLSYASSSSVYGLNQSYPFSTADNVDHPISIYAATKKSNELMAHSYSHLYGIKTTGLRFFTVYGPWGRPDMAPFLFTKAALEDKEIKVFNHGQMLRDFTYIDDIVEGVIRVIDHPAEPNQNWSGEKPDPATSNAPYKLYNIGNNQPVLLMDFIEAIEKAVGKIIQKKMLPLQPGDLRCTYANVDNLAKDLAYKPSTPLQTGINNFVMWYRDFYQI